MLIIFLDYNYNCIIRVCCAYIYIVDYNNLTTISNSIDIIVMAGSERRHGTSRVIVIVWREQLFQHWSAVSGTRDSSASQSATLSFVLRSSECFSPRDVTRF